MKKYIILPIITFAVLSLNFIERAFPVNMNWQQGVSMIIGKFVKHPASADISMPVQHEQFATVSSVEFIEYAKSLIGTPYVWGSVDPRVGFDCSGFVNHVSKKFGFEVPRSSVQFTDLGEEVSVNDAKPGDIILFTGTDAGTRVVGHMGIITLNDATGLEFVHSSSGKAKGVGLSSLEGYYETRFMKVIRLFPLDQA